MIPPSRNDSPNSPLLYTGNDAKDVRRRGHSTPETGVERFSVCWAGVDRRSSSRRIGVIVIRADESRFLVKEKKKEKRKTPRGRSWIVPLENHVSWSVFKSNVKYNIKRGEDRVSVWQRVFTRVGAGKRMLLSWKFDRREHNREKNCREGCFEAPVEWFHSRWACSSSIFYLSLFRPFSAPIPVSWLCLDVVGSWIIRVCGFVYVYVILGISDDGTFNPSWMVG